MQVINGVVYVACSVCLRKVLLSDTQPHKVKDGAFPVSVDGRPRSATGGRIGHYAPYRVFAPKFVTYPHTCPECRGVALTSSVRSKPRLVKGR